VVEGGELRTADPLAIAREIDSASRRLAAAWEVRV